MQLHSVTDVFKNDPGIKVGPPRWVWSLAALLGVVVLVAIPGAAFLEASKSATSSSASASEARRTRELSERSDCRTAYQADFTEVVRARDAIAVQSNIDFAGFLLGDPSVPSGKLATNRTALEEANAAVEALPKIDDAMDHGYQLGGVKHPPCPVVK